MWKKDNAQVRGLNGSLLSAYDFASLTGRDKPCPYSCSLLTASVSIVLMTELGPGDEGRILTWLEVSETHKTRNGIYQKNGELVSLLTDFGRLTPCYPDFEGDTPDTIFYTGSGRRGDQKKDVRNSALLAAVHSGKSIPLFCKLAVNRWKFLGFWRVVDSEYLFEEKRERMVWRFVLRKD